MTTPMDDEELLSLIGRVLPDDDPPVVAIDAAYAAFGWRTLDADLAQLIEDNQVEVVGFGQTSTYTRMLTYETASGTIEIAIGGDEFEVAVDPKPTSIVVRQPDTSSELLLDDTGRVRAGGMTGSIRFQITWPGGAMVLTPWLTL